MIKVTLKDGSVKEFEAGLSVLDIAKSISEGLARNACCGIINGKVVDLRHIVNEDVELAICTFDSQEGKDAVRHSISHVLAYAVKRLFPEAKLAIGPSIENGFYYDVDLGGRQITDADFAKVEKRMLELAREKQDFVRQDVSKADALKHFEETGDKYKCELISELADGTITYTASKLTDTANDNSKVYTWTLGTPDIH